MNQLIKRILSSIIVISLFLCNCSFVKAISIDSETKDLEEFKEHYKQTSFYQYIPQNMEEFLLLPNDTVLDVFEGIIVTKDLLNEDMILDIDRVQLDDIYTSSSINVDQVHLYNTSEIISPNQLVMPDLGGSGDSIYVNLPTGTQSAIVTSKMEVVTEGQFYGETARIVTMYLSNRGMGDFAVRHMAANSKSIYQIYGSFFWDLAYIFKISQIIGETLDNALSVALSVSELGSVTITSQFANKFEEIYATKTNKCKIEIKPSSISITEWSTNYFSYLKEQTKNGVYVTSAYGCYSDDEYIFGD